MAAFVRCQENGPGLGQPGQTPARLHSVLSRAALGRTVRSRGSRAGRTLSGSFPCRSVARRLGSSAAAPCTSCASLPVFIFMLLVFPALLECD